MRVCVPICSAVGRVGKDIVEKKDQLIERRFFFSLDSKGCLRVEAVVSQK